MAKPKGLIVHEDIVAQEFNLEEIVGFDLSSETDLLREIGDSVAEFVRKRAEENKGIGGKELRKPYSKTYQRTTEFELFGKSATDVNMRLTGDMLESINTLDVDGSTIVVGIEGEQAPKAHGHMTGKNGEVPKMKREFFGLTRDEFKEVLSPFKDRIKEAKPRERTVSDFTREESVNIDRQLRDFNVIADFFQDDV